MHTDELSADSAKDILYKMKLIRVVEESISERYSNNLMRCPTHLSSGQEAPSAVAGHFLLQGDYAVSTHRAHGHYLAKGGNIPAMLAEIYGKATGCSAGKGGSMHLTDDSVGFVGSTAIVGSSIPIGVGLAMACKKRGDSSISAVFLGDGATEEGAFFEAVNFAVVRKLPVIFICENNLYSVYSPLSVRQPTDRKISELASAMGLISTRSEGENIPELYKSMRDIVTQIRETCQPGFIEISTYRWREHCGPNYDNKLGYRTEEEYLNWRKKDPLPNFEEALLSQKKLSTKELESMNMEIEKVVAEAFAFAESSPFPETREAYQGLFSEGEVPR